MLNLCLNGNMWMLYFLIFGAQKYFSSEPLASLVLNPEWTDFFKNFLMDTRPIMRPLNLYVTVE